MGRGRKKSVEPKEEATYSLVQEGNEIIKKLCEKYPDILWACDPKCIQVYGIDNKEKPVSNSTLAKIRSVSGVFKAVLEQIPKNS